MSVAYSASKLKTYATCPRQYHWIYDLKLLQPKSEAMELGTRYHAMIRQFYNNEMIEGLLEEPTKDTVLKGLLEKNKLNPIEGQILDTESKFELIIEGVLIRGFFDRLDIDKTVEYKTTSVDYKPEDVDNFQTDIYILARYMLMGELLPMVYHVNNKKKIKTKKYKPQVIVVERSLEQLEEMKQRIVDTVKSIEDCKFEPKIGNHCFWCPYGNGYNGTKNCNAYHK